MSAQHSKQTVAQGIHIMHAYEYADAAARAAATGFVSADEGKVARQLDDDSFWILIDAGGPTWKELTPGTVTAHAPTHENGGSDEIDVSGLSGLLGDPQTPLSHATSHENGGGDELDVTGLSGLLADAQNPTAHASTHAPGSADAVATAAAIELTDSTNAEGTGTSLARNDHTHAHGNRGGGTLHADAISGTSGFMPGADKTKLDSILAGYIDAMVGSQGTPSASNPYVTAEDTRFATLIYAPSVGTPPPGVFNSWAALHALATIIQSTGVPVEVRFVENCTVPAGTWAFESSDIWRGPGFNQVTVTLADGCYLPGFTQMSDGIILVYAGTTLPCITNPDSATGVNIFRIGTRCQLTTSGTMPFVVNQQTFDTGVWVLVTDVNGVMTKGTVPVIVSEYISGASPVGTIITAVEAAQIEADTVATAGASEYAAVVFQQIGFSQAGFSFDQPNCDSALGPLQALQTFIGSPGVQRNYGAQSSSPYTMQVPWEMVPCDTSGGDVLVYALLPVADMPRGTLCGVKNLDGTNVARFRPASGSGDTVEGASEFALTNAGEVAWFMSDGAGNWDLAMSGNQTAVSPPAGPSSNVQVFTADGTWTKPSGAINHKVIAIGGGGGGGGGATSSSGQNRSGGAGGGGAGIVVRDYLASQLGASESVVVGTGGSGGAAGSTSGSNGGPGAPGFPTTFGAHLKAGSGQGGGAGENSVNAAGGNGAEETDYPGASSNRQANAGAGSFYNSNPDAGDQALRLPGGGGAGGGIDSTDTPFLASDGGRGDATETATGLVGGTAGVANGGAGGAGTSTSYWNGGAGGGGGGASDDDTVSGGAGGVGGTYGGGGGGGGAAPSGGTAEGGVGGDGGDGICVVISWLSL